MSNRQRIALRLMIVFGAVALLLSLHAAQQRMAFTTHLERTTNEMLREYLREAFPASWFSNQANVAPDTMSIRQRMRAFNETHWLDTTESGAYLRFAVTRAGPVSEHTPNPGERLREFSVEVGSGAQAIAFDLVAASPAPFTPLGLFLALTVLALGVALTAVFPHPASFNAFPLGRDMALLLDRKVSADRSWGAYRITHLGGGGQLPGIPNNEASACNDPDLRQDCLLDIRNTFDHLRPRLLKAAPSSTREILVQGMLSGFEEAERRLREESPRVWTDLEVSRSFRPFIRDHVLGFALISFADPAILRNLTDLPCEQIEVSRPPAWLIGGYEIYYPRGMLRVLADEIRSGLQSGFGKSFDRIRVSADPASEFIRLDFIATGVALGGNDADRIQQYLSRPFAGGLQRIVTLMEGFGRFSIMDSSFGFDLTQRRRIEARDQTGIVNRCEFRRIRPEELSAVRKLIHR